GGSSGRTGRRGRGPAGGPPARAGGGAGGGGVGGGAGPPGGGKEGRGGAPPPPHASHRSQARRSNVDGFHDRGGLVTYFAGRRQSTTIMDLAVEAGSGDVLVRREAAAPAPGRSGAVLKRAPGQHPGEVLAVGAVGVHVLARL